MRVRDKKCEVFFLHKTKMVERGIIVEKKNAKLKSSYVSNILSSLVLDEKSRLAEFVSCQCGCLHSSFGPRRVGISPTRCERLDDYVSQDNENLDKILKSFELKMINDSSSFETYDTPLSDSNIKNAQKEYRCNPNETVEISLAKDGTVLCNGRIYQSKIVTPKFLSKLEETLSDPRTFYLNGTAPGETGKHSRASSEMDTSTAAYTMTLSL